MDYDDFKKGQDERSRNRFGKFQEAFNGAMRDKGDPRTLDDVMGAKPREEGPTAWDRIRKDEPPEPDELKEVMRELITTTTDSEVEDAAMRALKVYRIIVRHVREGGTVRFYEADGETFKTLKVRVKT